MFQIKNKEHVSLNFSTFLLYNLDDSSLHCGLFHGIRAPGCEDSVIFAQTCKDFRPQKCRRCQSVVHQIWIQVSKNL